MPFDGSGNFARVHNWVDDRDNAIKITAVRHDEEDDNIAGGLNETFLRNGVVPMSGNVDMGDNNILGIADGTAGNPSISPQSDNTSGVYFPAPGVVAISSDGNQSGQFSADGFSADAVGIGTATPRTPLDVQGLASVEGIFEKALIAATALNGARNLDILDQVQYVFESDAAANFSFNIRGDGTHSLDSLMAVNESLTIAVEVPQGATAYYCTDIKVDGAAVSQLLWYGGAPTQGNINGVDVYAITVIKKAAATFKVRASLSEAY